MTPDDVIQAHTLLDKREDLKRRITMASGATRVADLYAAVSGTNLETNLVEQARQNVADFLHVALTAVEGQLTSLGVVLT